MYSFNYWGEIQNNLDNGKSITKLTRIHGEWFNGLKYIYIFFCALN